MVRKTREKKKEKKKKKDGLRPENHFIFGISNTCSGITYLTSSLSSSNCTL
jgi:hypothetical protein